MPVQKKTKKGILFVCLLILWSIC